MPDEIVYRPIVLPADAERCAANHRETCVLSYGDAGRAHSKSAYLDWLALCIASFPDGHLLAHVDGGRRFVGQLELEVKGPVGYVNLFFVAAPLRRLGFGRRLHERALAYFRADGCHAVELHVARANAPALRFYQSLGYKTSRDPADNHDELWMMRKELAGVGASAWIDV